MNATRSLRAAGMLDLEVRRGNLPPLPDKTKGPQPSRGRLSMLWEYWAWHARNWVQNRWRQLPLMLLLLVYPALKWFVPALVVLHSKTYLKVLRGDGSILDLGCVGRHLITNAGNNYVANTFTGTGTISNFKYHGFGIGTTAANASDTQLQDEMTTEYATDNTRPTGTQVNSTNTYTTVATFAPDSAGTTPLAVTEWGLLNQAANSGGTLLDREVFSAVNLNYANGDSIQATYVLTVS